MLNTWIQHSVCVLRLIWRTLSVTCISAASSTRTSSRPTSWSTPRPARCWLTGFGIASRLPRERQSPEPPEVIAGTLAYMAPEQTGRMNRSIDSRSDLYALGVTLYEMLTGSLPFTASDPMEWVHCHIARQPVPPAERRKDVPAAVSAIIMKLLAKTAEERYQTAAGLESDLRRCLAEWEAAGPHRRLPARRTRHARPAADSREAVRARARDRDPARRLRPRRQERHAGAGAGLRLFRHRQVLGRQRAAQGAGAAARPVCLRQVRPVQARHPLFDAGAGLSEPDPALFWRRATPSWRPGATRFARRWARTDGSWSTSSPN